MARFSQQMLAGLLNPSYQQELTQVGRAIGGAPRGMMMRQQKEQRQAEIQELLKQHANNPAKLQQLANEYRAQGNEDAATAFTNAATQATAKATAGQQRGAQGGLMAITQAAARGVPLENLQEGVRSVLAQGGTQADIMQAYKAGVDLAKGEEPKIIQGTPGTQFFTRDETGSLVLQKTVPFKDETRQEKNEAFELAKTGKYTPQSIQDAIKPDGSINYSALVPVSDSEARGSVSPKAEERNNKISEESTKASVSLSRNRALQVSLASGSAKSTGVISDLRTSALNLAGLRDAEEEDKTLFLRTRNTDIINGLPPGVASDADIEIFSKGFPEANASTEEIMAYLQAEERILAASSDMALVADRHLQSQIDQGLDATMVGFETKKQQYGMIMQMALRDIEIKTAQAETEAEAIKIEQDIIKQVSEVLGFVPKFYR